jgi:type III secretion system FlhB-like substrate exporter
MSKPSDPKKAVILRDNQVVGVLEGQQAEKAIAEAEAAGIEVRQDAEEVKKLINPSAGNSRVPEELYLLMSTIIEFAQELDQQWEQNLGTWDIEEVVDD